MVESESDSVSAPNAGTDRSRAIPISLHDITDLISDLARDRPIFHSEADFQHALAWCMHKSIPGCRVRLECRPFPHEAMYLDIWLPEIGVALELKYRTRQLSLHCKGESFELCDQRSQDSGCYDYLKDIQRLEKLRSLPNARAGFAILLTNDPWYWKHPSRQSTNDAAFRLHEGRTITGEMAWSERASAGTKKGHEAPIRLSGTYELNWQEYSSTGNGRNQRFRYLLIETSHGIDSEMN